MACYLVLVVFVAVVSLLVWKAAKRRKKDIVSEKFVCDVCHGSDCDCRHVDESKK